MKTTRLGLVLMLFVLASCQSSGSGSGKGAYGVFTELGMGVVPMKPGSNVRVFNTTHADGQEFIRYDQATGTLTLSPGTYRVDGYSITTFGYMLSKEQQSAVRSLPGYACFYNLDEDSVAILGSMQDPMYSLPSHVNDIVTVSKTTRFYLGHQNGNSVAGVLVQAYDASVTTSTDHVFAGL